MAGKQTEDNVNALIEMINYVNKGDTITFPGISLVYLNE